MTKTIALLLISIAFSFNTQAKDRILATVISVELQNTPIKYILKTIEEIGKVRFSYNPAVINDKKTVSISIKQQTIRYGLTAIFNNTVELKEVGNHILILEKLGPLPENQHKKPDKKTHTIISGNVYDFETKKRIPYASIYDVDSKYSTLSDGNGNFSLRVPIEYKTVSLYYAKSDYRTNIKIMNIGEADTLDGSLGLHPQIDTISKISTVEVPNKVWIEIEDKAISGELFSIDVSTHNENLKYLNENRYAQVSLIPKMTIKGGKNYRGILYNHFSLNILGGYSKGLKGLEIGGIANVLKERGYGLQAAGVINLVGSNFSGMQVSGISNIVKQNYHGLQFAGISNTVRQKFNGIQFAGVANHVGNSFNGLQLAVIGNKVEGHYNGIQVGGLINFVESKMNGIQIAGLSSLAKNGFNGAQFSGLINHTSTASYGLQLSLIQNVALEKFVGAQITGFMNSAISGANIFQLAGLSNIANKNYGIQIGGIVNYAKLNCGLQLGLINISKSNKGLSLGLVNFVWDGYHKIEVLTNETSIANIRVKSGVKRFYNIYSIGQQFDGIRNLTSIGFGFGAIYNFSNQFAISTDIEGIVLFNAQKEFTQLGKFSPSFDFKFSEHFAIFAGPTFNANYSYTANNFNAIKLDEYSLYTENEGENYYNFWVGGQFGIRF